MYINTKMGGCWRGTEGSETWPRGGETFPVADVTPAPGETSTGRRGGPPKKSTPGGGQVWLSSVHAGPHKGYRYSLERSTTRKSHFGEK